MNQQYLGLSECIPKGYPSFCGVRIIRGKMGGCSSKARKRKNIKTLFVPWYKRNSLDF